MSATLGTGRAGGGHFRGGRGLHGRAGGVPTACSAGPHRRRRRELRRGGGRITDRCDDPGDGHGAQPANGGEQRGDRLLSHSGLDLGLEALQGFAPRVGRSFAAQIPTAMGWRATCGWSPTSCTRRLTQEEAGGQAAGGDEANGQSEERKAERYFGQLSTTAGLRKLPEPWTASLKRGSASRQRPSERLHLLLLDQSMIDR
jgi:hypothetical protein